MIILHEISAASVCLCLGEFLFNVTRLEKDPELASAVAYNLSANHDAFRDGLTMYPPSVQEDIIDAIKNLHLHYQLFEADNQKIEVVEAAQNLKQLIAYVS